MERMKGLETIELREDGSFDIENVRYEILEPLKALSIASTGGGGDLTGEEEGALGMLLREKLIELDEHLGKLMAEKHPKSK